MVELFPAVQPEAHQLRARLPLAREVAWDYDRGRPVYSGGRPVVVTGAEAVKVWCWRALKVSRCRHVIYTWGYGSEIDELIGKPYTAEVKESEAIRYVKEALQSNPYVTEVTQVSVTFEGTHLKITCKVGTIYGEVMLDV